MKLLLHLLSKYLRPDILLNSQANKTKARTNSFLSMQPDHRQDTGIRHTREHQPLLCEQHDSSDLSEAFSYEPQTPTVKCQFILVNYWCDFRHILYDLNTSDYDVA